MSEPAFKAGDHVRVIHRLRTATFKAEGEILSFREQGGYFVSVYEQPGRVFVATDGQLEPLSPHEAPRHDAA